MINQTTWTDAIIAPLPEEKIRAKIKDDNPLWEFIDGEMVKLGALGHCSLNIDQIQQHILLLLTQESKDFRLMVHLLRTLQHGGKPHDLTLAVKLLCIWVEYYWLVAWPENNVMKRRLAQQIIKRFSTAASLFAEQADHEQREEIADGFARLAQLWQTNEPAVIKELEETIEQYRHQPERKISVMADSPAVQQITSAITPPSSSAMSVPVLDIASHDDKAWRHTQLKMADILCERQPENPLGYCLRRNAVWQSITSVPPSQMEGRTPLAAFSADRMAEYKSALTNPNQALWRKVEQSLTLAPYWFDGHHLSADLAQQLGYERVYLAIREQLSCFLQRLPELQQLSFNDRTPFLSASTKTWLENTTNKPIDTGSDQQWAINLNQETVWQCWQQHGLEAALKYIDDLALQQNPRGQFYCQLLNARLLNDAGLKTLAQQHYSQLYQVAQRIMLSDWEPELINLLAEQQINSKG